MLILGTQRYEEIVFFMRYHDFIRFKNSAPIWPYILGQFSPERTLDCYIYFSSKTQVEKDVIFENWRIFNFDPNLCLFNFISKSWKWRMFIGDLTGFPTESPFLEVLQHLKDFS